MTFTTDLAAMEADLLEVIRLYDPSLSLPGSLAHSASEADGQAVNTVEFLGKTRVRRDPLPKGEGALIRKRMIKRFAKLAVYEALAEGLGKQMPWGALTGIRPTKLYRQIAAERGEADLREYFIRELHVSPEKAELLYDTVCRQQPYLSESQSAVDVYVGIPFCTSRCAYCSFLSAEIGKCGGQVEPYCACLSREISAVKALIAELGLKVRAVYMGGGTPTSLPSRLFRGVLSACDFSAEEFTCEAGRPDTLDADKLKIMEDCGVSRISVNPQTFRNRTLEAIGRRHTAEDVYAALELAAGYGFSLNMDLICGLPGEVLRDFQNSLEAAIACNPTGITVHTLALKSGAALKTQGYRAEGAADMLAYAYPRLKEAGYGPYYLYRQKYMADNLENVGYARGEDICRYNVDIMEETTSVLACGANSITKRVIPGENRIERQADCKDVASYLDKIDGLIAKKRRLFLG